MAAPVHGPVPPATLIPLAEEAQLIGELGGWVLQRACNDLHRWQHPHQPGPLGIAVNVSAQQLMDPRYLDTVSDSLDAAQTDPADLTLEITETVFLAHEDRTLEVLTDLRRLGVTLALDDFGTGYAALNYLHKYPVDILKIDRSFLTQLDALPPNGANNRRTDKPDHPNRPKPAAQVIIAAIVQLAHGLGMTVIAEGVETATQHHTITDLGCTLGQGFYYAPPTSATAITNLLHNNPPNRRTTAAGGTGSDRDCR